MALTNRVKKDRPIVEKVANISRNIVTTDNINSMDFNSMSKGDSKKRKTIKVDPEIKSLIEIFSDFDGTKEYETLKNMAEFYYNKNYDERAQRIIANIQNSKYIN